MKLLTTLGLAIFVVFTATGQQKEITGTVTTLSDGLPLPGANVIAKNNSKGTQTDFDGHYSLRVNLGDILVVSYIGMKPQEVVITAYTHEQIGL
jgi:hypothetical protein